MIGYVLILTLVTSNFGGAGIGGVTAFNVENGESCHRIGQAWVDKNKRIASQSKSYYQCHKL